MIDIDKVIDENKGLIYDSLSRKSKGYQQKKRIFPELDAAINVFATPAPCLIVDIGIHDRHKVNSIRISIERSLIKMLPDAAFTYKLIENNLHIWRIK